MSVRVGVRRRRQWAVATPVAGKMMGGVTRRPPAAAAAILGLVIVLGNVGTAVAQGKN